MSPCCLELFCSPENATIYGGFFAYSHSQHTKLTWYTRPDCSVLCNITTKGPLGDIKRIDLKNNPACFWLPCCVCV